jgi:hypothetical protein
MTTYDPNPWAMTDADGVPFDLDEILTDAFPALLLHGVDVIAGDADGWTADGGVTYSPCCYCGVQPGTSYATYAEAEAAWTTDLPLVCREGAALADAIADGDAIVAILPTDPAWFAAQADDVADDDDD